ncbi:MAG: helix-turn-helix transcriptional regulator [Nocardioides sp.]
MSTDPSPRTADLQAVAALADPLRRSLYDAVAAAPGSLGRDEAATQVGVPVHTARFHLDRLVAEGLFDVEFRRLNGRTGPGSGRPSKLYRRRTREVAVSLPPRSYDLVGSILAAAVERSLDGCPLPGALAEEAVARGREAGRAHEPSVHDDLERAEEALAAEGFEPTRSDEGLCLRNCPFDALARSHTALVCGINRDYVGGLVEGLGCEGLEARLDPAPDRCCVVVGER